MGSPMDTSDAAAWPAGQLPAPGGLPSRAKQAGQALTTLADEIFRLEMEFCSSGDALLAEVPSSPPVPTVLATPLDPEGALSDAPSEVPHILATLEQLAVTSTSCDTAVSHQLTTLRGAIAGLASELNRLSDRSPVLQRKDGRAAHPGGGGGSVSSPLLFDMRTPPITSVPSSTPVQNSMPGSRDSSGYYSPPNLGSHSPLSLHQATRVTSTAASPSAPLLSNNSANPSAEADTEARSPVLFPASATPTGQRGSSLPMAPALDSAGSPNRSAPLSAPPASPPPPPPPPIFSLVDRAGSRPSAAQLPHTACLENVKKYLGNCVEWPPRPRGLRRSHPRFGWTIADNAGKGAGEVSDGSVEKDATPTPHDHPKGSRGELPPRCGSLAQQPTHSEDTCSRSETDEFLRCLTEESPYDFSMLNTSMPHLSGCSVTRSRPSSIASNHSGDVDEETHMEDEEGYPEQGQRRLSSLGKADRKARPVGADAGSGKCKRHRSSGLQRSTPARHTPRQRTGGAKSSHVGAPAPPPPPPRRGRPSLQESVDALVLAQLRADGISLPPSMVAELMWCEEGDTATSTEKAATDKSAGFYHGEATKDSCSPVDAGTEVDPAAVLREIRDAVRQAQTEDDGPRQRLNARRDEPSSCVVVPTGDGVSRTAGNAIQALPPKATSRLPNHLSMMLPTTSTWLEEISEFCILLDDMAASADVADGTVDATMGKDEEEEGAARQPETGAAGVHHPPAHRRAVRPPEQGSPVAQPSPRIPDSAVSSREVLTSSYAAGTTGANETPAAPAEELFSADDGEDEDGNGQHRQRTPATSTAADTTAALRAAPISLMASPERSLSPTRLSARESQYSMLAPSFFGVSSRSVDLQNDVVNAVDAGDPLPSGQGARVVSASANTAAFYNSEPLVVVSERSSPEKATTLHGTVDEPHSADTATSHSAMTSAARHAAAPPQLPHILTPGARSLEERRRRDREAQQRRFQTLQHRQEMLLHRRHVRTRVDSLQVPVGFTTQSSRSTHTHGDPTAHITSVMPEVVSSAMTSIMDFRAAAHHLRTLCAQLRSDLLIICALQELSRQLYAALAVRMALPSVAASLEEAPLPCEALTRATQLVLSLQEYHSIQRRVAQESGVQFNADRKACLRVLAPPVTSIVEPLVAQLDAAGTTPAGGTAGTGPVAPLMLSVLHPMCGLGYLPLLANAVAAGTDGGLRGPPAGEAAMRDPSAQHALYVTGVAPYLLAWQAPRSTSGRRNRNSADSNERRTPQEGESTTEGGFYSLGDGPAAPETVSAPLLARTTSRLPLTVWVYLEAVTTSLIEEARKLHEMYALYVLLVAESALQSRSSSATLRAGVTATSSALAVASLWHGGSDETLMAFVRRRGRAACLTHGMGVWGVSFLLDNGLEKFVGPVSVHLLKLFDELESRQLLYDVFQSVQLSDVAARRQARHQLLRQLRSSPEGHSHFANTAQDSEREGFDSFALPRGALSSSPALRNAASVRWSMRDAEQRTPPAGGDGGDDDGDDPPTERRPTGDVGGGDTTPQRRRRGVARRLIQLPGSGDQRHAIIEGFVRYLTRGDRRRESPDNAGEGNSPSSGAEARPGDGGRIASPPQRAPSHGAAHQRGGLTLDVPHTSVVLQKMDSHLEAGASNGKLLQAVERQLYPDSLTDLLRSERPHPHEFSGVSVRHYFNTRAAAFTTRYAFPTYKAACLSVVQCRWQPVFQSTMWFCPVTRRRCLDPLVCGALLVRTTLPPHEIFYSVRETSAPVPSTYSSRGLTEVVSGASQASPPAVEPNREPPSTVHIQRNRFERTGAEAIEGQQQRQTRAPSPRLQASPLRNFPVNGVDAITQLAGLPGLLQLQLRQRQRMLLDQHSLPPPQMTRGAPVRIGPFASFVLPALRGASVMPDTLAIARIVSQTTATGAVHADSAAWARTDSEGEEEVVERASHRADPRGGAPPYLLRSVTIPLDLPPTTRNLLASPDKTPANLLNPPTLLECGHVISHKTYLDLRTSARRTNRSTAAAVTSGVLTVVCCPYCSKVTPVKDALTLSYIF